MIERVAVVGLGKLGQPMAAVFARAGFQVFGADTDPRTVNELNFGQATVDETGLDELVREVEPRLQATTSTRFAAEESQITFVIVPTPSLSDGAFDNRYVLDAVSDIGLALHGSSDWHTVVICSTVMPGSVDGPIRSTLEEFSGRTVGVDVGLCYSPEFIALGSVIHDMTHPDMVLLGANDERSRKDLREVIEAVVQNQPSWEELSIIDAEIAKISVNTYVTMKISFANELGRICEQVPDADAHAVARAIGADSRIGHRYLRPAAAFGGPCFPRDTRAFTRLASNVGIKAHLSEATEHINHCSIARIADRLRSEDQVSILGLAYKPDTSVWEASFGYELAVLLQHDGIKVVGFDPAVRSIPCLAERALTAEACVAASDTVVIATPWPEFADLDYTGKRVIDMWNIVPEEFPAERVGRWIDR